MNGILLVDKPAGWTSFDVVAKVRGTLRAAKSKELRAASSALSTQPSAPSRKVKVGHTGTLDPLATGLLVLVLGDYCKRAQEFSKLDKNYETTMRLGLTSSTGDEEGDKSAISDHVPTYAEIEDSLKLFVGDISQVPPAHSAIKVNGQRAYKLARAGKEIALEPRPVHVESLLLTSYVYPEVTFTADVGSGTYIRSLVADIGKQLQTGAYMTSLRRTRVGDFEVASALQIDEAQKSQAIADNLVQV